MVTLVGTRRMCFWAAVFVCAAGVGGIGAQEQKALGPAQNLDFEAALGPHGLPSGWGGGGKGYEPATDSEVVHGGKQSGRIAYVGEAKPGASAFGTLVQGITPDEFRGQRIRYSGYVRTEKVDDGWAGLWMRVDGPETDKPLAFDNMESSKRPIVGTTGWTEYEIVLDVPKEATAISFGLLLSGQGTVWVDDLKLQKAEPATPTTDTKLSATPQNLDFEAPLKAKGHLPDWGGGGEGYEVIVDNQGAHGGKQSGRIAYIGDAERPEKAFGTFTQGILADNLRGGRVRYTGFVRTDNVVGEGAGLWMRVDGLDKPLAFDNMLISRRAITGTTDWTQYEIELDVPKDATEIFFGVLLAGRGTAWVDDLKIEKK